jgi:nitroimidazol reductase NimA-like FMN-containing flavoprotein (pyridoxamine 5'-phosphate oxidase superfamily)
MADKIHTTSRTTIRRHSERGRYERQTVEEILDEGLVGHLAFVHDGHPYGVPMLYVRSEDVIYLHGSPQSRVLGAAAESVPLCLTVTLVDGLVLARSAFHHSVNYRSVMVLGRGRRVAERAEKLKSMELLVEHIVAGRTADARGPSDGELKATEIVAMTIDEASAKVRTGPPIDSKHDMALSVWAGELPLALVPGTPIRDAGCDEDLPRYVSGYHRNASQPAGTDGPLAA